MGSTAGCGGDDQAPRSLAPEELERIAAELRRIARLADDDVRSARSMAGPILGAKAVTEVPRLSVRAALLPIEGRRRIFVRLGSPDQNFDVAHELGHEGLIRYGYQGPNEEAYANYIAAALIAPPKAVHNAYAHHGEKLRPLAKLFGLTESSVWLRLAEVRRDERVLIAPGSDELVRVRGLAWPENAVILKWYDGATPLGIAKKRLSDDPKRVGIRRKK